jgi:hypothetical protein
MRSLEVEIDSKHILPTNWLHIWCIIRSFVVCSMVMTLRRGTGFA